MTIEKGNSVENFASWLVGKVVTYQVDCQGDGINKAIIIQIYFGCLFVNHLLLEF